MKLTIHDITRGSIFIYAPVNVYMETAYVVDQYPDRPLTNVELWEYEHDSDDDWTEPLAGVDTKYGTVIVSFIHCIDNTVLYVVFDSDIEKWVVVKTRSKFDLASAGSGGVVDIVQRNYSGADISRVDGDSLLDNDSENEIDTDYDSDTVSNPENIQVFTQTIEDIVETLPQTTLTIADCAKISDRPGVSIVPHVGNATNNGEADSINISNIDDENKLPRPIKEILSIVLIVNNGIEESENALVVPIIYVDNNWEPVDIMSFDPETERPLSAFESTNTNESEVVSQLTNEHGYVVRLFNKIQTI